MADNSGAERTEEATPYKRQKEKEKGNVPNSRDTSGFVVLAISLLTLFLLFAPMLDRLFDLYVYYTQFYSSGDMEILDVYEIIMVSAQHFLFILLPIAGIIMISGVIGNVSQFGFIFSAEPLKPKLSKISPLAGIKRLFALQTFVNGFKMVFQVSVVFIVASFVFWDALKELPEVNLFAYFDQLVWLRDKAIILIGTILGVLFLFAFFDLAFTRQQYSKRLRMTKQEVKEEFKNIDGNPEIKQRIRQVQREMAQQRMEQDVAQSDVVITNPTHYAVAILYDPDRYGLPIVTAKGTDALAMRIKSMARESGVPIVENKFLARQLYKDVKVGQTIPERLFKAIAEVLVYVGSVGKG